MGSSKNSLKKWFFEEPWFERFSVEPDMVLLWPRPEEPFPVPDAPPWFCVFLLRCETQRCSRSVSRGHCSSTGDRSSRGPESTSCCTLEEVMGMN